jgi:hypothetical protein
MSKAVKIILGIVIVLVILAVLLGVGIWGAYKWVAGNLDDASISQMMTLQKSVSDFSATLPEGERSTFQACWQQTNSQEFQEKVEAAIEERAGEECDTDNSEAMDAVRCAMNVGLNVGYELSQEHFEFCKQQINP